MRQEEFEKQYKEQWQMFEKALKTKKNKKSLDSMSEQLTSQLPSLYRKVCHSLAIAKQRQYSPFLIEHLDNLAFAGHQLIYTRNTHLVNRIVHFLFHGFPRAIQENIGLFWLTSFIFYGPGLIIFLLTLLSPELVYSIVPTAQVADIESMYDPEARILGRERESDSDFYMFGLYIQNNIGIAFRTFATGILFTLGSLFFLIFNGLLFGALSGHMINVHYTSTFFPFVIGHGSFELTAIVISGMAGIKMGWSLIAPGNFTRLDALKLATQKAIKLMYGALVLLIIAAFVEAFWSSSTNLTIQTKYYVGGLFWILILTYLLFPRRGKSS